MAQLEGAVYEYLNKLYNGLFRPRENVVTVQLTETAIVPNNADRVSLVLVNIGANNIWIFSTQQGFAASTGIRVAAAGGITSFNVVEDSVLPSLAWFGRADAAATNLFVVQVVREAKV